MKIYFQILPGEGSPRVPTKAYPGDAGWDLYVSRDVVIPAYSFTDIHTDIAIALPEGLWGRITGRSSTLRKYGLLVNEGIIDNGYRGELFIGVFNLINHDRFIPAGTRLAQLILHWLVEDLQWEPTIVLPPSQRQDKGFGSSGQ
jgi:dUTP pyrophosphatase